VTGQEALPVARFLQTLEIVFREGTHLHYSWGRVFSQSIDAAWVRGLDDDPLRAEALEAFVSRFGRMQDTIAGKLLPRWLLALAETPGSQIETLNRAERLGILADVQRWLEARNLRNRLVHEYANSPEDFAEDLMLARERTSILFSTYNQLRHYAAERMDFEESGLPSQLPMPGSAGPPEPTSGD
jgi:hypothetical protein